MKDPYVYDNGTLINKFGIEDYDELNQKEADLGAFRLITVDSIDFDTFDPSLLQKIHHHVFQDIFDWAGEFRTVPIVKNEKVLPGYSIPYTEYSKIEEELTSRIQHLNSIHWDTNDLYGLCYQFAREMALLWKIHPFRDGNTRTILCFSYLYAKEHGFPFDMNSFTESLTRKDIEPGQSFLLSVRDRFVLACLDEKDYPEVEKLASLFYRSITGEMEKSKKIR